MKKLLALTKLALFTLTLVTFGSAMYPAASEASVTCWDEGHKCHIVEDDGTVFHHGKFFVQ